MRLIWSVYQQNKQKTLILSVFKEKFNESEHLMRLKNTEGDDDLTTGDLI